MPELPATKVAGLTVHFNYIFVLCFSSFQYFLVTMSYNNLELASLSDDCRLSNVVSYEDGIIMYLIIKTLICRDHLVLNTDDNVIAMSTVCRSWRDPVRRSLGKLGWKKAKIMEISTKIYCKTLNHIGKTLVYEPQNIVTTFEKRDSTFMFKRNIVASGKIIQTQQKVLENENGELKYCAQCIFGSVLNRELSKSVVVKSEWYQFTTFTGNSYLDDDDMLAMFSRLNLSMESNVEKMLFSLAEFSGVDIRNYKSPIDGPCVVTPGLVFKWVENIWNTNGTLEKLKLMDLTYESLYKCAQHDKRE